MFIYSLKLAIAAIQYTEVVKKDIINLCTNTYFILSISLFTFGRKTWVNLLNLPKFSPTNILHHGNENKIL